MRGKIENDVFSVYDDNNKKVYSTELKTTKEFVYFDKIDARFIPLLKKTVPKNKTLMTEYDKKLINFGFKNPQMCKKDGICLYMDKDDDDNIYNDTYNNTYTNNVEREYEFLSTQLNSKYCEISLKINPRALTKLQTIITENKDETKEIFGSFKIVDNKKVGGYIIHTIDIIDSSLKSGSTDDVSATPTIYNFHTHPISAYKMYNVKYGPPSVQDYKSIYLLCRDYNCIVHLVASLEGIYIVYLLPEVNETKKNVVRIIEKNFKYNEDGKTSETYLAGYLQKINAFNIFKVELRKWSDPSLTTGIKIQFRKSGKWGTCKIHD